VLVVTRRAADEAPSVLLGEPEDPSAAAAVHQLQDLGGPLPRGPNARRRALKDATARASFLLLQPVVLQDLGRPRGLRRVLVLEIPYALARLLPDLHASVRAGIRGPAARAAEPSAQPWRARRRLAWFAWGDLQAAVRGARSHIVLGRAARLALQQEALLSPSEWPTACPA